ncbi:carbohydrate ABC transporter permease [uncultured Sphaerochaeta sp.]|uniref:carbohydrate ABC transporter permease n=1 Tax=uncultured Sphaerochaeta sp. TaxID=886478 RepID=UPI002A0A28B7|nr:carbohydrate ABC transporter permease [uncultured Sphaerochaeta sp.]
MPAIKKKQRFFTLCMWILALLMIYPFIMMVVLSFRPQGLVYKGLLYPIKPIASNFLTVLTNEYFGSWYLNTIVTVVLTIVLRLIVTLPASYALSRLRFPGQRVLILFFLATYMVPAETTMVPRYLYFKNIGLLDSLWSIVLPEMTEILYLVLLMEFFRAIPKDFSEAGYIDGASHRQILTKIFIPLAGPSLATVILFSFINIWNNFLDPYLFITTTSRQLITPALKYFQERGGANIPVQMAGANLAIIPVIILFTFTQKYFVAGVSSSGIKG